MRATVTECCAAEVGTCAGCESEICSHCGQGCACPGATDEWVFSEPVTTVGYRL